MADYRYARVGVIRLADDLLILPDRSNPDWLAYLDYIAHGGEVDPALPPADPDPISLIEAKARKRSNIGHEAATRVSTLFPGQIQLGTLAMLRECYLSIAPAARAPTATWTAAGNIVAAAMTGVAAVNAATTLAEVDAVAVTWP